MCTWSLSLAVPGGFQWCPSCFHLLSSEYVDAPSFACIMRVLKCLAFPCAALKHLHRSLCSLMTELYIFVDDLWMICSLQWMPFWTSATAQGAKDEHGATSTWSSSTVGSADHGLGYGVWHCSGLTESTKIYQEILSTSSTAQGGGGSSAEVSKIENL